MHKNKVEISASDFNLLLEAKEPLVLLDVREREEFELTRLENSTLIPVMEVEDNLSLISSLRDSDEYLIVATTRPETIPGDTAIAVNPEDPRYKKLIGQHVHVPLIDRLIPIIADDYADKEFGTGCLKVTPAHDPNDFQIGRKKSDGNRNAIF